MTKKQIWTWLLFLAWAVFVNACNVWIIRPLAEDFALLGVAAIVVLAVLWVTSVPTKYRRVWIGFTIFSLLVGDGLGEIATKSWLPKVAWSLVTILGLTVIGWAFTRFKYRYFLGSALVLLILNWLLPLDDWAFLTHFQVAYRAQLPMQTSDIPALPLQVIHTARGTSVVTLENIQETDKQIQNDAQMAGDTPDSLENMLRNAQHRYAFVELVQSGGHFHLESLPTDSLSAVDPMAFTNSFFPFIRGYWIVDNGKVVQYMAPAQSPTVLMDLVNNSGYLPSLLTAVGESTERQETQDWQTLLTQLKVPASNNALHIEQGRLIGMYNGQSVSIPVHAYSVIATGSFTAPGAHEVLLQGVNDLEVVSLDTRRVVTDYHGDPLHPLPSDVVTGPIDNSGRDVIFVNSSPAIILQAEASGKWRQLYQATNDSLRFETSVRFPGDAVPEIITDDPSYIRNSPVRYFTSYTYRDGQLVRNWRVFKTNLVNVNAVQFTPGGPQYIVASNYGTGELFVLKRHRWPVVPAASVLLGITIISGWWLRLKAGRRARHA